MWLPAITLADGCSDYWRETFRGVCGIRGKSSCDRRIMAIQTVARTSWSDAVAYQRRTTKTTAQPAAATKVDCVGDCMHVAIMLLLSAIRRQHSVHGYQHSGFE
jgi:hypothetical protein